MKSFLWFRHYGSDLAHLMKIGTTIRAYYHRIVSTTKWTPRVYKLALVVMIKLSY